MAAHTLEAGTAMMLDDLINTLPPELLQGLIQDMLDHNVPPIFLSRRDGWGFVGERQRVALELLDSFAARLTSEQRESIWSGVEEIDRMLATGQDGEHLALLALQKATEPLFFALPDCTFAHPQEADRVFRQYPELLQPEYMDKKGLLEMRREWKVHPQALFYGSHALSYHQLLRRAFTSNLNDELIGTAIGHWRRDDTAKLWLALDGRRLLPAEQFTEWLERDFWDGPHLSEDLIDDPRLIGVTRHGNPEPNLLRPYWQFLVSWSYDADQHQKTCEMEELLLDPRPEHCRYILMRYMHCIRDVRRHTFIHADGAMRGYLPSTYTARVVDRTVTPTNNPEVYRKVWRLDGAITSDTWSDLVARWFRGNQLAVEYLGELMSNGDAGLPNAAIDVEQQSRLSRPSLL